MQTVQAVGIDLGTTYSNIAYLNEQGEPVTLPNQEGELSTPSVVLFDGDRAIVGTEALRNAIAHPDKVVQASKRFMGDAKKRWAIGGKPYTPVDIATVILKKLISAGQEQIGAIEQAVITVPAQFSDAQRHATVEAGHRAGLKRVDIINEPVAAALCHVLGSVGIWFEALAADQRIMVYDLGGGTFDLSLVTYRKDEVSVIASSGDLNLGGIDWNQALMRHVAEQFVLEFGDDPRANPSSLQALALEAEQAKRSLSVRPTAAMSCKHDGHRKAYQISVEKFEELTRDLVEQTAEITKRMLSDNNMGWAHVDVVLTTGGASRMPMIRNRMKQLSGRTLNTTLSPDLSIAHGATYYAGMLMSNDKFAKSILSKEASRRLASLKQRSVNARALGVLVKNPRTGNRVPHYFLPANTPLPADATHSYGTVVPNQKRVHLQIVESGTAPGQPPVMLGSCIIHDLPPNLPEGSEIAVTISYDSQAKVHVSAKDVASGKRAHTEIVRQENVVPQLASDHGDKDDLQLTGKDVDAAASPADQPSPKRPLPVGRTEPRAPRPIPAAPRPRPAQAAETQPVPKPRPIPPARTVPMSPAAAGNAKLEKSDQPVPLCNNCGEPLNSRGQCTSCGVAPAPAGQRPSERQTTGNPNRKRRRPAPQQPAPASGVRRPIPVPPPDDAEILELGQASAPRPRKPSTAPPPRHRPRTSPPPQKPKESGEDEFWQLVD
jgi:molecular chaperone DnaK